MEGESGDSCYLHAVHHAIGVTTFQRIFFRGEFLKLTITTVFNHNDCGRV
jgi:hypothetical protein